MFVEVDDVSAITDRQWKNDLRIQLEAWEDVEELIKAGKTEEALKKIEKTKKRLIEGITS